MLEYAAYANDTAVFPQCRHNNQLWWKAILCSGKSWVQSCNVQSGVHQCKAAFWSGWPVDYSCSCDSLSLCLKGRMFRNWAMLCVPFLYFNIISIKLLHSLSLFYYKNKLWYLKMMHLYICWDSIFFQSYTLNVIQLESELIPVLRVILLFKK